MIAEEVNKVYPDGVWKENGVIMGLKLAPLLALTIKAIQELQEK